MCKDQGRSSPEIQGKKNKATNGHRVKDRGFEKVREVE